MNHKYFVLTILASLFFAVNLFAQNTIKAGQAIKIEISGVPSDEKTQFAVTFPVSDSGMVNLPYIGPVRAAGIKGDQLARSIEGMYKSRGIYTNPTIQVIISSGDSLVDEVVTVGGQVARPGPVKFSQGLTLYQAVQNGGGANAFGDMKRVKLYRAGKMREYNLTQGQFMGIPLERGDTIEVPHKGWIP